MAAWANLSNMTNFDISGNSMNGTLPNELASAWPRLAALKLSYNQLTGKVPAHTHRAAVSGGLRKCR